MPIEKTNKYYSFYTECISAGCTDFYDKYQGQKIQLFAKKHKLIQNSGELTIEQFEKYKKVYETLTEQENRNSEAEENKKINRELNDIRAKENEFEQRIIQFSNMEIRDRITYVCDYTIRKNKELLNQLKKDKRHEFNINREKILPAAIVGGTIEALTGSTLAGIYNAANYEAVNETKRKQNSKLKKDIEQKYDSLISDAERAIKSAESFNSIIETAYIDSDSLYGKYLSVRKIIDKKVLPTGSFYLSLILDYIVPDDWPNKHNYIIDGTAKALAFDKNTQEVKAQLLLLLSSNGRWGDPIEAIDRNSTITEEELDNIDIEIVDYNLSGIEFEYPLGVDEKKYANESVFAKYYVSTGLELLKSNNSKDIAKGLQYLLYVCEPEKMEELNLIVNNRLSELSSVDKNNAKIAKKRKEQEEAKKELDNTWIFDKKKKEALKEKIELLELEINQINVSIPENNEYLNYISEIQSKDLQLKREYIPINYSNLLPLKSKDTKAIILSVLSDGKARKPSQIEKAINRMGYKIDYQKLNSILYELSQKNELKRTVPNMVVHYELL